METQELNAAEQALLNTQFPPEIEKLAEMQIIANECVEALQAYGAAKAEGVLMSYVEGGEQDVEESLTKEAAAAEVIEQTFKKIRAQNYDTETQLSEEEFGELFEKEAQAAATAIADGFFGEIATAIEENPELVKEAAKMGFMKKVKGAAGAAAGAVKKGYKGLKHHAGAAAGKAKEHGKAALKYGKKHGGKIGAGAAVGAAAGAAAMHHHDKK